MLKQLGWLNTWNSSVTEMVVCFTALEQVMLFIGPFLDQVHKLIQSTWLFQAVYLQTF